MGAAKRKQLANKDTGRAARYCIWFWHDFDPEVGKYNWFSKIIFYAKTDSGVWDGDLQAIHDTNIRAVGCLGIITAFMRFPANKNYRDALVKALGQDSLKRLEGMLADKPIGKSFVMQLRGRLINIDNQDNDSVGIYPYLEGVPDGDGILAGEYQLNVERSAALATENTANKVKRIDYDKEAAKLDELEEVAKKVHQLASAPTRIDASNYEACLKTVPLLIS